MRRTSGRTGRVWRIHQRCSSERLYEPEVFFQIGMEPVRIAIMTSVTGLDFVPAWERKVVVDFGGESAQYFAAKTC